MILLVVAAAGYEQAPTGPVVLNFSHGPMMMEDTQGLLARLPLPTIVSLDQLFGFGSKTALSNQHVHGVVSAVPVEGCTIACPCMFWSCFVLMRFGCWALRARADGKADFFVEIFFQQHIVCRSRYKVELRLMVAILMAG